ncbi:MAG TPA: molybdenum cofactor biosynthesis protein MoaE, partial [Bacteroidota bacterium]
MPVLTLKRIDPAAILAEVTTPESGGIDMFIGTTRNHSSGRTVTRLEYEAYEPMALKVMEQLELEAKRAWPLHKVALVHRLGEVPVLEASVLIAVSSAHRKEAFEACRFLID